MNRRTALSLGLALLAVVALGVAAATLDSAVEQQDDRRSGLGAVDTSRGGGVGDVENVGLRGEAGGGTLFTPLCIPVLESPPAILAILAGFGLLAGVVYRQTGDVLPPLAFVVALGAPVFLVWALLTACGRQPDREREGLLGAVNQSGAFFGGGGGGGTLGSASGGVSTPEALFGVLLVVALALSVVLLVVGTGDDERPDEEEAPAVDPVPDVAAAAQAAGEAADRIEGDADLDNEVYRAWREMTAHLDVERPRSSTPAEFATAAVDAGMDAADVDALTRVFEEVRYGGAEPTAEREERAVAALRRIEATHADVDAGANTGTATGAGDDADADADPDADADRGDGS